MSKTVAIVVFAGVQSLDVTGPMDVFSEANRFLAPQDHYRLEVIGVERGVMAVFQRFVAQRPSAFQRSAGGL